MYEFLNKLTYNDLDEDDQQLADLIGLENFKKFVDTYGGTHYSVKRPETLCIEIRNRQIRQEFDGSNHKKLAVKYGLTEVSIYRIVSNKPSHPKG